MPLADDRVRGAAQSERWSTLVKRLAVCELYCGLLEQNLC